MDYCRALYAQLDCLISICVRFISSKVAQLKTTFLGGLADGDFIHYGTKGIEDVCREHFATCPVMIKHVGRDHVAIGYLRGIAPPQRYIAISNVPVHTQVRIYTDNSANNAYVIFYAPYSGSIRGPSFVTAGQLRDILRELYPIEDILKSTWFKKYGHRVP